MRKKSKPSRFEKLLVTALSLSLILGLTVGVSIAFVLTGTGALVNNFVPAHVEVTAVITEDSANRTVSAVEIVNDKSNIPVYIRVAAFTNWKHKDGGVCGAHHDQTLPAIVLNTAQDWVLGADGYYYYTEPVSVDASTANLLLNEMVLPVADDGCVGQLYVLATAIQAQGSDGTHTAWQDAWGVDAPIGQ